MSEYVGWFLEAEQWTGPAGIPNRVVEHLLLTAATMLVACAVALPVGIALGCTRRGGAFVVTVSNASRAIPTFAG